MRVGLSLEIDEVMLETFKRMTWKAYAELRRDEHRQCEGYGECGSLGK